MERIVSLESESIRCEIKGPAIQHQWQSHDRSAPAEVLPRLQGASVALVNKLPMTRAIIEALPELKLIAVSATGTNNVDLEACREKGLAVCNVRGYARYTLSEHVFTQLLARPGRYKLQVFFIPVAVGYTKQIDAGRQIADVNVSI